MSITIAQAAKALGRSQGRIKGMADSGVFVAEGEQRTGKKGRPGRLFTPTEIRIMGVVLRMVDLGLNPALTGYVADKIRVALKTPEHEASWRAAVAGERPIFLVVAATTRGEDMILFIDLGKPEDVARLAQIPGAITIQLTDLFNQTSLLP